MTRRYGILKHKVFVQIVHVDPDLTRSALFAKFYKTISIFRECVVWIEKSVMRVTDRHREACLVMPNSDLE